MLFTDILRTAFMNLWRRKLRAVLTVLGMVIGVSSIVVMMSLGIGIKKSTMESYASMGSLTNITVSRWSYKETATGGTNTEKKLDKTAVETIKKIPGVKAVMPQIQTYGILKSGKWMADCSILAIDSSVAEEFGLELSEGRYPKYKRGSSSYEMVLSQDVLLAAAEQHFETTLSQLMRPVHFVPETAPADRIFLDFFDKHQHLFVVVDEYGSVTGVISMEDILEEIIGREIVDESDTARNMRELARLRKKKRRTD